MSSKVELQRKLKEIGYELGPYASKETLSNVLRLHQLAMELKGTDVATLNDLDLRKSLAEHNVTVGPVTNHTRAIYQRKLLELLTNQQSEGQEDEFDVEEVTSTTPPRATRSSIVRNGDTRTSSSPGRILSKDLQEPRISLTRIDVDDKHIPTKSTFYPNVSNTKSIHSSTVQETITNAYSPQRSTSKVETRPSIATSQPLRNPYDFQNNESNTTRHEHKATPFRTTNVSSIETLSNNINRYTKLSDNPLPTRSTKQVDDLNEIRSRILSNNNERKEELDMNGQTEKKSTSNNEIVPTTRKSGSTIFYSAIAIGVGLFVFVLYLWLEN